VNFDNEHSSSNDVTLNEHMDIDDQINEFDNYLHQYQFSTSSNSWSAENFSAAGLNNSSFDLPPQEMNQEQNNDCPYYTKLQTEKSADQHFNQTKEFTSYSYEGIPNYPSQHTHGPAHHQHHHHHPSPNTQAQYFTTYQEYLPCRGEKTYACSNI